MRNVAVFKLVDSLYQGSTRTFMLGWKLHHVKVEVVSRSSDHHEHDYRLIWSNVLFRRGGEVKQFRWGSFPCAPPIETVKIVHKEVKKSLYMIHPLTAELNEKLADI